MKTIVGLFSTTAQAQQVKQALIADGYDSSDIKVVANDSEDDYAGTKTATSTVSDTAMGVGEKISNFFHSLTGSDEHTNQQYATGVTEGGALLAVQAEDSEAEDVALLLNQHGARNIDGNYTGAVSGVPAYGSSSTGTTGQTAIPIVEESLVVGKREVDRGGVRVYSHVVEQPVSAEVTLREEQINIERRPVDRAATAADFATGAGVIELNATGEEALVGKTSRVVEEVLVGKTSSQRTEAIHDTVRKTEVDVEELKGAATTTRDRY